MATDGGAPFARDLGYLGAFFDKLEAHAGTLGGQPGERLRALVGEERRRWAEITALLGGAPAPAPKAAATAPAEAPREAAAATPPAGAAPASAARAFTVGPLRGRAK